jgi:hypothetical protein
MTTPKIPVGKTNPPLPKGTEVWVNGRGDTVVVSAEVKPSGYVYYTCEGNKEPVSGAFVYRRAAVLPPPPIDPTPPSQATVPGSEVDHAIHTDESVTDPTQRKERRTPGFLRAQQADAWKRIFGPDGGPKVTDPVFTTNAKFEGLARLIVNGYRCDETGLEFGVTVLCNVGHVAKPHDLIPITLNRSIDDVLDTIVILTPPPTQNMCTFTVAYTWDQLAKLLHVNPAGGTSAHDAVVKVMPQAGVRASWWDNKTGNNAENHYSGGVDQKNGSGRIDLRVITVEDLKAAEAVPNTSWNAGEPLRDERPVFQTFSDILQPGKEMATTLEAESEYLVDQGQYNMVLDKLKALHGDKPTLATFGVEIMDDVGAKTSTDSYYDVPGFPLLRRAIVLRRRSVDGDLPGTFLFAVKGRTVSASGSPRERIRLASQVHLQDNVKPARLAEFLTATLVDNAFARVLADGLGPGSGLTEAKAWLDVAPRLILISKRIKYSFELAHSTTIDFSADMATATNDKSGVSQTIYSIEFGVGHPGLFVQDTPASGGTPAPAPAQQHAPAQQPAVARPYHVPADLDNQALFSKPDYLQYQHLRDQVMTYLFGSATPELKVGGNKANTLATMLGLI